MPGSAVPKKRRTSSKQGKNRSHQALQPGQLVPTTAGELIPRRLKKAAELGLLKLTKRG